MYIDRLERHMTVCSKDGAARITGLDKGFWNVVSIHGPDSPRAFLPYAKTIHRCCFDDTEDDRSTTLGSPRGADLIEAFDYIAGLGDGRPRPPLLIHCHRGIARSSAVALSWIYGHLPTGADRPTEAIDILLELRPQAAPNRLVLALGLARFVGPDEARGLADRMLADPRLARNRPWGSPQ